MLVYSPSNDSAVVKRVTIPPCVPHADTDSQIMSSPNSNPLIQLEPNVEIAPAPAAMPSNTLDKRQSFTTISVLASTTPSSIANMGSGGGGSGGTSSTGFPIAVAIPALVGGMAAAAAGFGLWWWISKRKSKKRRERWEASQRRKARRANANGRPSTSTSRNPSTTNLRALAEKEPAPPVPTLPRLRSNDQSQSPFQSPSEKQGYALTPAQAQAHAYAEAQAQRAHDQAYDRDRDEPEGLAYNAYSTQPHIDHFEESQLSPTYSTGSSSSGGESASSNTPLMSASGGGDPSGAAGAPTKPSRSVARVAVADSAAANAGLDPTVRYQPRKPSPLALKAQQEKERTWAAQNQAQNQNYGRGVYDEPEEYLSPDPAAGAGGPGPRHNVTSGEWGVALGSPNHDPSASFADQQAHGQGAHDNRSRYSNDPYLAPGSGGGRSVSGQYTTDPYAGYHNPVANNSGSNKRSNWV